MEEYQTVEPSALERLLAAQDSVSILVVCMNGQTRSKAIAKVISGLGYQRVYSVGVNDPNFPEKEKIRMLISADVIVTTGADVESETRHLMSLHAIQGKSIIPFPISETDHIVLKGLILPGNTALIQRNIESRLLAQGFKKKSTS